MREQWRECGFYRVPARLHRAWFATCSLPLIAPAQKARRGRTAAGSAP